MEASDRPTILELHHDAPPPIVPPVLAAVTPRNWPVSFLLVRLAPSIYDHPLAAVKQSCCNLNLTASLSYPTGTGRGKGAIVCAG